MFKKWIFCEEVCNKSKAWIFRDYKITIKFILYPPYNRLSQLHGWTKSKWQWGYEKCKQLSTRKDDIVQSELWP